MLGPPRRIHPPTHARTAKEVRKETLDLIAPCFEACTLLPLPERSASRDKGSQHMPVQLLKRLQLVLTSQRGDRALRGCLDAIDELLLLGELHRQGPPCSADDRDCCVLAVRRDILPRSRLISSSRVMLYVIVLCVREGIFKPRDLHPSCVVAVLATMHQLKPQRPSLLPAVRVRYTTRHLRNQNSFAVFQPSTTP